MEHRANKAHPSTTKRSFLVLLVCILILATELYGQEKLDSQALLRDTQNMLDSSGQLIMVWWIPEQIWQAASKQSSTPGTGPAEDLLKVMRRYTLIAVLDGQTSPLGGITFKSEDLVRNSVTVRDARGASYTPFRNDELELDMKIMLQAFKPKLTNLIGPVGQNLHFLVFPSQSKDGRPIADAKSEGAFDVVVAGKEFKYLLPLGSVLPPKYDPKTGDKFPGNYNYNPLTGTKLVTESPNAPLQTARLVPPGPGIPPPPPPPPPSRQGDSGIRRVSEEVQSRNLIFHPNPAYPPLARTAQIQGPVILAATIAEDGTIRNLSVVSAANPQLLPGVLETVRTWRYKPTILNGQAVQVITTITINFALGGAPPVTTGPQTTGGAGTK
jgi:TonB family protein